MEKKTPKRLVMEAKILALRANIAQAAFFTANGEADEALANAQAALSAQFSGYAVRSDVIAWVERVERAMLSHVK